MSSDVIYILKVSNATLEVFLTEDRFVIIANLNYCSQVYKTLVVYLTEVKFVFIANLCC